MASCAVKNLFGTPSIVYIHVPGHRNAVCLEPLVDSRHLMADPSFEPNYGQEECCKPQAMVSIGVDDVLRCGPCIESGKTGPDINPLP